MAKKDTHSTPQALIDSDASGAASDAAAEAASAHGPEADPLFNQSLEKGLAILSAFDAGHSDMSLAELAARTQMNKASVQRSVHTLQLLGYVGKDPQTRRFHLLPKVVSLGFSYLVANPMVRIAQPFLAELSKNTGETANLTEPCGLDMVYVSQFVTTKYVPVHTPIGMRIPMYCTSSGRAYLSKMPDAYVRQVLSQSKREKRTPATHTDARKIFQLVKQAGQQGFALNLEELFTGDMGVAAPVCNGRGMVVGAVHVSSAMSRWREVDLARDLAPQVMNCASFISRSLSHY